MSIILISVLVSGLRPWLTYRNIKVYIRGRHGGATAMASDFGWMQLSTEGRCLKLPWSSQICVWLVYEGTATIWDALWKRPWAPRSYSMELMTRPEEGMTIFRPPVDRGIDDGVSLEALLTGLLN